MLPSIWALIRLDLFLEAVCLVLSMAVAFSALRAYRATEARVFLFLGLGFLLMSSGMLVRVVFIGYLEWLSSSLQRPMMIRPLLVTAEVIYSTIRLASYLFFVVVYAYFSQWSSRYGAATMLIPLQILIYNPIFEVVSVILLFFVVLSTALNWFSSRSLNAFLVFAGFTSLILSHVLFIFTPLGLVFYLAGHILQFLAIALILTAVLRAGRHEA